MRARSRITTAMHIMLTQRSRNRSTYRLVSYPLSGCLEDYDLCDDDRNQRLRMHSSGSKVSELQL